jgi:hypothetical protein
LTRQTSARRQRQPPPSRSSRSSPSGRTLSTW